MQNVKDGLHKQVDALEGQRAFDTLQVQLQEGSEEMSESSHLDELEAPLTGLGFFLVAGMCLADYLKGVEELVDGARVKDLLPGSAVVLHARHAR